jgi:hypothetical protein
MIALIASTLLVVAEVPAPPKPGIPPQMVATDLAEFKAAAFELSKRVQADPDYAAMDVNSYQPTATVYFKGDAAARLARYTSDPRFKAASAPLSAAELGAISASFMLWAAPRLSMGRRRSGRAGWAGVARQP